MHIMSRQDRAATAAHERMGLLRKVRTLAVQQTPARDYRTAESAHLTPLVGSVTDRAQIG
jgi:hypothetical protein